MPVSRKINFTGVEDLDIYNPSAPFEYQNQMLIAARCEPRGNHSSRVFLFVKKDHSWHNHPAWNPLFMEDPFFFRLGEIPFLGGVQVYPVDQTGSLGWRTVVFNIASLKNPELIFRGPKGMKDIRFIQYRDGVVGVFTRLQGVRGGLGTCGYLETDNISSLGPLELENAPLISAPDDKSWEGVNQPILLDDDLVGLLGHIAWMGDGEIRHYYAAVSKFFRPQKRKTPWKIIADRSDLPLGPSKRKDLIDVIFPGGMNFESSEKAVLYLGVSDTQSWTLEIPNPLTMKAKDTGL